MNHVFRTNVEGLDRDPSTRAIINNNDSEYLIVLREREKAKRLAKLEKDVDFIKNELRNIKSLIANKDK